MHTHTQHKAQNTQRIYGQEQRHETLQIHNQSRANNDIDVSSVIVLARSRHGQNHYTKPASPKLRLMMMSFTASNTAATLLVSVAQVRCE